MGAGIPGMGIASLFYVAAALIAPFRELVLTVQGRSSLRRWRAIGRQFVMALFIVAAVVALYVGINYMVSRGWIDGSVGPVPLKRVPNFVFAIVALVAVLVATALIALWLASSTVETPDMIAAAHRAGIAEPTDIQLDLRNRPRPALKPTSVDGELLAS
jgi:hypothetical protein